MLISILAAWVQNGSSTTTFSSTRKVGHHRRRRRHHNQHKLLLKMFAVARVIFMRRNPGAAKDGA